LRAEIISVGTELLLGDATNTTARFLAERLALLGIDLSHQVTVGDDPARLTEAIRIALGRAQMIVITGGLGPTPDDITRESVSQALDVPLRHDEGVAEEIRRRFERARRPMPRSNLRQALVLAGAKVLRNPMGTAPGQLLEREGRLVILLPGPPTELETLWLGEVEPWIEGKGLAEETIRSTVLKTFGLGESKVAEVLEDLLADSSSCTTVTLVQEGEVHVKLTSKAPSAAEALRRIETVAEEVERRLAGYVFGRGDETLPSAVARLLTKGGHTLGVAESCTAGLMGAMVTSVPGSSRYFLGGVIAYANDVKRASLDVPEEMLSRHGAVSNPVALAMARGASRQMGADIGIGITGIAGPGGGSPSKPVGTVFIAITGPYGSECFHHRFMGDREGVRLQSAKSALFHLWRYLRKGLG